MKARDLLLGHIALGTPIEDAAAKVGVRPITVEQWRTDPQYDVFVTTALRIGGFLP